MVRRSPKWINSTVMFEALIRYQEGRLPRSMRLWVEQLLELDHDDLIRQPLQAVEGLYTHFGLTSWPDARGPIEARIDQAGTYVADPVRLPLQAERHLQSLMEESA